jgi:DNA-binding XRE family transcriptional regulator
MKPKYTNKEFEEATSTTELPCECYQCSNTFLKIKKHITFELKHNVGECKFCSQQCLSNFKNKKISVNCSNCSKTFKKNKHRMKLSLNHFCSRSCSATYNNIHKTYGTRRSKLECWLEQQLTALYPTIHFDFNKKTIIKSELDIYIPSLSLAFELNGIFHYEPIFGIKKLNQTQNNDISKSKACFDAKVDLCIIDVSSQNYFKEPSSIKFLDIIRKIIDDRLLTS